jgi:hypothetical protein
LQLTQLIADKEKKSSSYRDNKLDALSDEKVVKIKKFAKEYIAKVVRKAEKSGHKKRPHSSSAEQGPSSALDTPNSIEGVDTEMTEMTVEEAMDMDPATESDDEGGEEDGADAAISMPMEVDETSTGPPAHSAQSGDTVDSRPPTPSTVDPRRPPNEEPTCAWDPHERTDPPNGGSVVA